jgi:hypothetical protein
MNETKLDSVPLALQTGTAVYGTVRTVVWEGGGRKAAPYPMGGHYLPRRAAMRCHCPQWRAARAFTLRS